jgi:hypothetical protein
MPVLRRKLGDFEGLRLRVAPELAAVASEYIRVLSGYVGRRARPDSSAGVKGWAAPPETAARRSVVAQLDSLEARVLKMRPAAEEPRAPGAPVAFR